MPHIHEKIDFTVEVYVVHKNKVLLRQHDKYLIWLSIGGHVELNEDPNEAAKREVTEEVGLKIKLIGTENSVEKVLGEVKSLLPPIFLYRHSINEVHEHVTFVYFAESENDKIIESNSEKSNQIRWFSDEELKRPEYNIRPHVKYYAEEALKMLGDKK